MNLAAFHDDLQRLSETDSIEQLTERCRSQALTLGFDNFVYALRVPTHFSEARLIMLDGYPNGWVQRYFEQSHFSADPVMAHCANHLVPVQWSDLQAAPNSAAERVMNEAGEFGLRGGVSMPIHSPRGELGILSLSVNRPEAAAREVTRHALPFVQLLGAYLHEAVRRVSGLDTGAQQPALNARETECLRWAADGKTSGEIASILNLAQSTVNFHLNNAVGKLDVSNRQHAVARAALQGLIRPRPF
jgi:DNA-binding CsgD family transcriptional regulator